MRAWFNDLVIGIRLAVGGGRTSVARLVLSTVGIGIAVAVLLLASSVGPMIDARYERAAATQTIPEKIDGVDPLWYLNSGTSFRGESISVAYVWPTGHTAPVPPGIPKLPFDGDMYVTPALAELLAQPGNDELRARFPYHTAGVIAPDAVIEPGHARAYVGAGPEVMGRGERVYGFGSGTRVDRPLDPSVLLLLLLGSVALLVPVFIFVAASTRIAGAERDRRLSALRLVGADSAQVRRIAAAESLVSAMAGLLFGTGLFLAGRQLAEGVRLRGVSVYPADIVPVWWMAILIVLAIPVLAVSTAQFAMRRTIIEPLGVVRFSKPVRRRMAWRFATVGLGVALLLAADGLSSNSQFWAYVVASGATLVLIGVPLLLPWVVERTVAVVRGGPSSWQLAIRRLQLDSGTSSRVVGGVAVVLAGAIALQCVLASLAVIFDAPREFGEDPSEASATVMGTSEAVDEVAEYLSRADPAVSISRFREAYVRFPDGDAMVHVRIVDCPTIERQLKVTDCADGQFFVHPGAEEPADGLTPGRVLSVLHYGDGGRGPGQTYGNWTVPPVRRALQYWPTSMSWYAITTPQSFPVVPAEGVTAGLVVDPVDPETLERIRTGVALARWDAYLSQHMVTEYQDPDREMFVAARRGLLIGSMFTLLLAGTSLLVLALEHIRERRRPLAILAASGVPTGALARSLLWQIAVPIGLGMVLAVAIGVVLAALVMRLAGTSTLVVDWAWVGTISLAAVGLVLLVSLVTMPFLRGATRLSSMRTE
ncbi:FtsX-like permease family protein [Actinokineospora xionganensis]|uniref:ABC transporter permease n=1 Tax=Actinokineospora xionganensis TaxID=2684470 RepID=A0ABR7L1M0_9PSEU|nr:FtsX-like permease family protein [Actinokineospora xionganensis]MBC6446575.1 ABC transporter permease [Actinokineospora xionganensis]